MEEKLITIKICNDCDGLVGWDMWRPGCCLGGMGCHRVKGSRTIELVIKDTKVLMPSDIETLDQAIEDAERLYKHTGYGRVRKLLFAFKRVRGVE